MVKSNKKKKSVKFIQKVPDFSKALIWHQGGDITRARSAYERILKKVPDHADTLHLLGVIHFQEGRLAEAEELIRKALSVNDKAAPYWNNLGEVLRKRGRLEESADCFKRALTIVPNYADAHNNVGNLQFSMKRWEAAVSAYEKATQLAPGNALSWYNLGSTLRKLNRFESALKALQHATELAPSHADSWNNLGLVMQDLEDEDGAEAAFCQAICIREDHPDAQANLGYLLLKKKQFDEARILLEGSLVVREDHGLVRLTLAMLYGTIGLIELGFQHLSNVDLSTLPSEAHSNALFYFNYAPDLSSDQLVGLYRQWAQAHAEQIMPQVASWKIRNRSRLRIGYVSGDFKNHAVKCFLEPLLAEHDHKKFDIFLYSNVRQPDTVTLNFQQYADCWRDVARLSDDELAALIREDEVDILVDLSGHTEDNRLLAFARRPAPLQISWLGYGCTTGMTAIDYFVGDQLLTPSNSSDSFVEALYPLPCPSLVYRPNCDLAVTTLPALKAGYITFGSLTRLVRINRGVIDTWAKVLQMVPGSRIYLNQPALECSSARDNLYHLFAECGIGRERVMLVNVRPHWSSYQEMIDICLDPFPHNAGTTTFEALWMGVPVVSLRDRPPMGRYGDMILTALNHPEWVADTVNEYVMIAVTLAQDLQALATLRSGLRERMRISPLMDEVGFSRNMELAYQDMWSRKREAQNGAVTIFGSVASDADADFGVETGSESFFELKTDANVELNSDPDVESLATKLEKALQARHPELAMTLAKHLMAGWPEDHRGAMGMGVALRQLGQVEQAIVAYKASLTIKQDYVPTWINLGRALTQIGHLDEAVNAFNTAIKFAPRVAMTYSLLSHALRHLDDYKGAEAAARNAIALDCRYADAWQNLGNALRGKKAETEAAEAYQQVLRLDPNNVDARTCIGSIYKDRALYPEVREIYEEGLRRTPHADDAIWANYFFCLNYDPDLSAEEIASRYFDWGNRMTERLSRSIDFNHISRDPDKKLRIGFVSADFNKHVVRFFIFPWLEHFDRKRFDLVMYHNSTKSDTATEQFRGYSDEWRNIRWLTDAEVLEQIEVDQIDILIDLSSHTGGNRLNVFAARAAPVQITWLGTGYTTGLPAMDYFVADEKLVPNGSEGLFSEHLLRLPVSPFVYLPEFPHISCSLLPALHNGYVTFGSLSRTVRYNTLVIQTWSRILHAVPTSVLRIDHPQVMDKELQNILQERFAANGIGSERLQLVSTVPYWSAYDEIDIALDPFPHNGGTTTIESLWKGVPLVTLRARPSVGRFGDCFLSVVGLENWVADSLDEYVALAVQKSSDIRALAVLRNELRWRVEQGGLLDAKGFALHMEKGLRMVWARFCDVEPPEHIDVPPQPRESDWVQSKLREGTLHLKSQRLETAKFLFDKILRFNPDESAAWLNLGACWRYEENASAALTCFEHAVAVNPEYEVGWYNLGVTLQELKQFDKAEFAYKQVIIRNPNNDHAWNNLGVICKEGLRAQEALQCYRHAVQLQPEKVSYLCNLGELLERGDKLTEAQQVLERCIKLDSGYLPAYINLGLVYRKLAMFKQAMQAQSRAAGEALVNHPMLFTANYHPELSSENLFELYRKECKKLNTFTREIHPPLVSKIHLTVGLVGGDFRGHAAAKFILPLLMHYDRNRLRIILFANQCKDDSVTALCRSFADWVNVYELDDETFIRRVRKMDVDILIDVAGWTVGNRLLAMAKKPAPVQITWLGYGYTTGLKAIDWFIGDDRFTPPGCERFFSEQIFRMKQIPLCFHDCENLPPVTTLPALTKNKIVFGHLGRTVRLNAKVIHAWSAILKALPNSFLVLDNKPFADKEVRHYFEGLFIAAGAHKDQLMFRYSHPHWPSYADIDICLDPFPHNAGTTTIESLLMGVPVISLRDRPPLGCYGDAILGAVGMSDWVTNSVYDYVQCAVAWANRLSELATLRQQLRSRVAASPLGDGPGFAQAFTDALFSMWNHSVRLSEVSGVDGEMSPANGIPPILKERILENKTGSETKAPITDGISNLVNLFNQRRYDEGEVLAWKLTAQFPENGFIWKILGAILKMKGRIEDALGPMQKATKLLPRDFEAHSNLGITLKDQGKIDLAEISYLRAIAIKPDYAGAHYNLGIAYKEQGRLTEAEASYRQALKLKPDFVEVHINLGNILHDQGRFSEAKISYMQALALNPDHAQTLYSLSNTLHEQGEFSEAESGYRRALELKPDYVEVYYNLGVTLKAQGRLAEAEAAYRRALQLKPDFVEAIGNLGSIFHEQGRLVEAEASYRHALVLKPDSSDARQSLSSILAYLSNFNQVVMESDKALQLKPDSSVIWEQRLYAFSYHPDLTAENIYKEFIRWGDQFPDPVVNFLSHDRNPTRRLRVGYLSPDFRRHTSRFYFWPLFANHDHTLVELYAYSNVRVEDNFTLQFKGLFDHWRNIRGIQDNDAAQMIRKDKIDILVDCCNHMRDDRLGIFILKPAPIQVTWLGSAWTTGLRMVDYVLFDPYLAPEHTLAREDIVRLPHCFVAYLPPEETAELAPPPCLRNGFITFGYSGRTERLNYRLFRVWGEILRQIPDAKLLLDFYVFADPSTQAYYRDFMVQHGIDINRVIMRKSDNIFEGLNDIDILLDCFPHSGGTMLFDALWMGVPFLTLASRPPLGRIGTSLLTNIGLAEWIAVSDEEYITKACTFATDSQALVDLRVGMRERMANSPVMDGAGFARGVEAAYREMFSKWRVSEYEKPSD